MWIVKLALRRPYTFVVMAFLIAILGTGAIVTMPVDIFPYIDIPVVTVIWNYSGVSPEEMEKRFVTIYERTLTTTVNDIEHMESTCYTGVSITKVFFQPKAHIDLAIGQVTAISQTLLRIFPPGTTPPNILKYDASSVPILQLGLGSKTLSEQEIFDLGQNFIRTQLAIVPGASVPLPYGGRFRQVMVDLNPEALYAKQLSATDVSNAIAQQSVILPAGSAKLGDIEYQIKLNSSPRLLEEINHLPIRVINGATVYIKDVGHVRDGYAVQTNIVRTNGIRGSLLTVMRNGSASTLAVVDQVKAALPKILAGLTPELKVRQLFDQSIFVRAAIQGVLREAIIAAFLTALMILLFLGSWRSTIIVCISIPLSILTSLAILSLLGETINVMTLGGLALAVGILVDDATVEIENTHRNMAMQKPLVQAVLDGAMQIAAPAFVSTLSICIVFVPVLLLTGAARYLFTPLAGAVVFAMMASYLLSRTLVPTMVHYMLKPEVKLYASGRHGETEGGQGVFWRVHYLFNRRFEMMRSSYTGLLHWSLDHRALVLTGFGVFVIGSMALIPLVGRDFFPTVDSGQMRLHARLPVGTRLEKSELRFADIEAEIRHIIPDREIDTILDNIGIPFGGLSLAFGDVANIGGDDGDILISLKPGDHAPIGDYTDRLRKHLHQKFPDVIFFWEAANITNQILNFGIPSPIDLQVQGRDAVAGYRLAREIAGKMQHIPGAADVHVHQVVDYPEIRVNVNRNKAEQLGLTTRDVSSSLLISLSSSAQVAPNQWLNWANGVTYSIGVQTPQYRLDSLDALMRTPISSVNNTVVSGAPGPQTGIAAPNQASLAYGNPGAGAAGAQMLSNLAEVQRGVAPEIVSHYNTQPVFDVYANVDRRDLGSVGSAVDKIMQEYDGKLPRGMTLDMRGQYRTMQSSFYRLGLGLIVAVVLVYLLMAVNFQSWRDPAIILMCLPGALAGIVWMLFVTQTTFNVPSLMGAIMCIGVGTANSILMVVFANDQRVEGLDARSAALSAGHTRIRPVLMTALAMVIGMAPMALGFGEGGEQNAPLGRAVIGGLTLATITTLFIVPIMYSLMKKKPPVDYDKRIAGEEAGIPDEILD